VGKRGREVEGGREKRRAQRGDWRRE